MPACAIRGGMARGGLVEVFPSRSPRPSRSGSLFDERRGMTCVAGADGVTDEAMMRRDDMVLAFFAVLAVLCGCNQFARVGEPVEEPVVIDSGEPEASDGGTDGSTDTGGSQKMDVVERDVPSPKPDVGVDTSSAGDDVRMYDATPSCEKACAKMRGCGWDRGFASDCRSRCDSHVRRQEALGSAAKKQIERCIACIQTSACGDFKNGACLRACDLRVGGRHCIHKSACGSGYSYCRHASGGWLGACSTCRDALDCPVGMDQGYCVDSSGGSDDPTPPHECGECERDLDCGIDELCVRLAPACAGCDSDNECRVCRPEAQARRCTQMNGYYKCFCR